MKRRLALWLLPALLLGQPATLSLTVNIVDDLRGTPDARITGWGPTTAGAYASEIHFEHVPDGKRVRILRVYGNFVAVPLAYAAIPPGTGVEVGWGLKSTAPDTTSQASYPGYTATPFGSTMLWIQDFLVAASPVSHLTINQDVSAGGLLEADNTLLSQAFVALNTTGLTIHMEPTITIVYRFETVQ